MKKKEYSEDVRRLLKTVFDDCQSEDTAVRERQIRQWRRLKLLWEGFHNVWYSEVAHDWRIWDETQNENSDQAYYDKPINVFRAYLETIIAALSVIIPPVKCFPDNADDTLDLATARAGDKISELIYRHNNVSLLWLHALFIFVTEGMVACYSYPKEDEEYGTYETKDYEDTDEEHEITTCSICGFQISDQNITGPNPPATVAPAQNLNPAIQMGMQGPNFPSPEQGIGPQVPEGLISGQVPQQGMIPQIPQQGQNNELNSDIELSEFMPDSDDVMVQALLMQGKDLCPACMQLMDPAISHEKFVVTRMVGISNQPKSRMCLEVYGGLYVKVANYAKCQKDTPYLVLSYERDYALVVNEYEHLHGKENLIKKIKAGNNAGGYNQYDQWGRLSPQYQGEYPINVVTVNHAWIRPAKFNVLNDIEDVRKLKKLFPFGVKVTYVNDEYAEACPETLDDCWTLLENPLSEYLHFDPAGRGLVSIQEVTNDLVSLTLQTIEHGIGQTFADPAVVSFNAYESTEVVPGGIFPATPKSGKSLSDGFHELKTATLSSEVMPFSQNIQSLGQLVSGALPSLFGGQLEGSETASEYSMSRAQSLQRLQNNWKMLTAWWKTIFGKVIPMYIKTIQEDERDVQQDKDGNFINVLIRKADLEGKIGKVELEANENLPMTWNQRKDTLEKLLTASNPELMAMLGAPENISLIHEYLGLNDFYVPGEDDVIKQYDEIKLLLNSEPLPTMDPMNPEESSVPIDLLYDNHKIEFEIVRKWAISEIGRLTKTENETGYRNVLLHGKAHFTQLQMAAPQIQQAQGAPPNEQPNQTDQEAPIMGNENVQTIQ